MGQEVRLKLALLVSVFLLAACGAEFSDSPIEALSSKMAGGGRPPYKPPVRPPLEIPEVLPTTLTESISRSIKVYPSPTSENFGVFTSYFATRGQANLQATWNPKSWGASVNLSPIAWHDTWTWPNGTGGPSLGRGIAITKRHLIAHHIHGTEDPGFTYQFVRRNGEIITRTAAQEYEMDSTGTWRLLWLNEDLPDDMVAALPTADSRLLGRPIANLDQFNELHVQYVQYSNTSWIPVAQYPDPDPLRCLFFRAPIIGDSGKPLFGIIGNEIVALSFWWTTGGGSSMLYDQAPILAAVDRLSVKMGDSRMLRPRLIKAE